MSREKNFASIVDFPEIVSDPRDGYAKIVRSKDRPEMHENEWTAMLLEKYESWRELVDLPPATSIKLETTLTPLANRTPKRGSGFCRVDAFVTHHDGRITIIESKVSGQPTDICAAIGQLVYYKTLAEAYWQVEVCALVLASRFLPEMVAESIANVCAPIRFLKATDAGEFFGLVPQYGRLQ